MAKKTSIGFWMDPSIINTWATLTKNQKQAIKATLAKMIVSGQTMPDLQATISELVNKAGEEHIVVADLVVPAEDIKEKEIEAKAKLAKLELKKKQEKIVEMAKDKLAKKKTEAEHDKKTLGSQDEDIEQAVNDPKSPQDTQGQDNGPETPNIPTEPLKTAEIKPLETETPEILDDKAPKAKTKQKAKTQGSDDILDLALVSMASALIIGLMTILNKQNAEGKVDTEVLLP